MASSDDSDTEYSGYKEPPLVKRLRKILDRYPNNGQIIKELVQNAEDAGAQEMGILFDNRDNNRWAEDSKYNKHFKGAALGFHNDAVFTDKDWEGISMIESSLKEDDPLTVGRFGLGFKSVFHLTDFPCIISGEKIMFINPHVENKDHVFGSKTLRSIRRSSQLDSRCVVSALDGIFGFSQKTLDDGYYDGTLFWFPLRKVATDLSRVVYNAKTVEELLNSFMKDAVNILLFLSRLEKIEVFRQDDGERRKLQKLFSICIEGNLEQYRSRNNTLTHEIKRIGKGLACRSVYFISEIEMKTEMLVDGIFYRADEQKWLIVKLLKGGDISETFQSLIQDDNLPYCPCVGVASPLQPDLKHFKGHVFCALPLPLPGMHGSQSLTNLPVHVNGIFALNQNRSQLEWITWDQPMPNTYTIWNECMLSEALPEAYHLLLTALVSSSIRNGNDKKSVEPVYRCIPKTNVVDIWTVLSEKFLKRIIRDEIIFTENNDGKWIRPEDAVFASFEKFTVGRDVQQTVRETLKKYDLNFAEVPNHVLRLLKHHKLAKDITPPSLCTTLCDDHALYQSLPNDQKINLLQFLLCDDKQYSAQGLELLPLANGKFAKFSRYGTPVYMASAEEVDLFPHFRGQLVCTEDLHEDVCHVLRKGLYQVKNVNASTIVRFLEESVKARFGTNYPVKIKMSSSVEWLSKVWRYIISRLDLYRIVDTPLVPVETGNGLELHKLTDFFIMKQGFGNSLPDGVCRALESMSVTVIRSLPPWLNYYHIQDYLYSPSVENVVKLLGKISLTDALCLNTVCNKDDRRAFVEYIGKYESLASVSQNAIHILRKLKIFTKKTRISDASTLVAVEEFSEMLEKEDFPVRYPRPFLVSATVSGRNLAIMLGVTIVKRSSLIVDTLKAMQQVVGTNRYLKQEKIEFMKYLLRIFNKIENNSSIINAMKFVAFVECAGTVKTASDVFDPTEHMASDFFYGERVFPDDTEFHREPFLSGLLKLGMRRLETLQSHNLQQTAECLDRMSKSRRCDQFIVSKSKAFQKVAEKYPHLLSPSIRSLECVLPLMTRVKGYPEVLQWFGSTAGLCTPNSITSSAFASLVGSVQPVTDTKHASKLTECFEWNKPPNVSAVIRNFQIVIKAFRRETKPQLLGFIESVYTYLSTQHPVQVIQQVLEGMYSGSVEDINIILCGQQFVCPRKVYFNDSGIGISLQPYLYKLSSEFQHFNTLFTQLGCHECVTNDLLLEILEEISDKYDTAEENIPPEEVRKDSQIVMGIINRFRDTTDEEELKGMSILIPIYTRDPNRLCLKPARDCTYCDSSSFEEAAYEQSDSQIMYAHPDIAEKTARKLGVMTKERRRLKDNSVAISFGQKETLVTRLKGLLKGYPCDTGIMKELIQNADDAKATEIHFIKDYRTHGTEKVLDEKYCPLQGPALCVFNNSAFTQEDLKGIQDLGIGSKAEDPTKTGQYGVGFNAVYNLTDAPSFFIKGPDIENNETLCFFDPTCRYIPDIDAHCPGSRIINLQKFRRDFPDMLSGYLEGTLFENRETGTLFRLPLRLAASEISHHFKTPNELDDLLKEFETEVLDMLLFVKNVTKITISNISSGQLVEEYTVDVSLSKENQIKRENLFRHLKTFSSAFERNKTSVLDLAHARDFYEMKVKDSKGEIRSWCIVQQIGFESNVPIEVNVRDAYGNGHIGLLPQGGIAVLLHQQSETNQIENRNGKAFCFLPLPIDTGLPVEVHGHFSLDHETRRTLWEDKGSYRTQWNQLVLKAVVAPAYVAALQFCLRHIFPSINYLRVERQTADCCRERFENYFPLQGSANGHYWKWLSRCIYQYIYDNEERLFPVFRRTCEESPAPGLNASKTLVSISWTALNIKGFKFPAFFVLVDRLSYIADILQRLGMRIIRTSAKLQESVTLSDREAATLSKKSVISFLRSHNDTCKDKCQIGCINVPVEETCFQDLKSVRTIADYCLQKTGKDDAECLDGIPLLITNDGYLRQLTVSQAVFSTPYCDLLPSLGKLFVNKSLLSTFSSFLFKKGLGKDFSVKDFLNLFSQSVEQNMFETDCIAKWNPDGEHIPNKMWIQTLWSFIWNKTRERKQNFENCLTALGQFSFVPSTARTLHPISELYTLIRKYTFEHGSKLRKAVERLNLPELQKDCLPDDHELFGMLNEYIASADKPEQLLKCFSFHSNRIYTTEFSCEESVGILRYFANSLNVLKQQCDCRWIQSTLKSMRLYTTQQNTLVSIEPDQDVLVLPGAIPIQGIELWASQKRKLLLQEDAELEKLYTFLGFRLTEPLNFYRENVQTLARELSEMDFMEHLMFIKNVLLTHSYGRDCTSEQKNMICALANTPFVRVGRTYKKVCELKSPRIIVFNLMCTAEDFPPKKFDMNTWHDFFVLIGLRIKVTGTQYLEFAHTIASEGRRTGITNQLEEKSVALTKSLMNETKESLSPNTLHELSRIKFLVPARVEQSYRDIFRQKDNASSLICYDGSVAFENGKTFWTTVNLLPRIADPNCIVFTSYNDTKWLCDNLNILPKPTDEQVILHCKNIGDALKEIFERMKTDRPPSDWITSLMGRIYDALMRIDDNLLRERLSQTPLVFLPDDIDILPAYLTILNCTAAHEIPPYLRKIPSEFGTYHALFQSLGASQEPSLGQYMHVLYAVQRAASENELTPPEFDAVRSAISNTLKVLENNENQTDVSFPSTLYLPDSQSKLTDAKLLVISDSSYIQRRVEEEGSLVFFLGLEKLRLGSGKVELLKKLKPPYRPIFLTEITDQKVDTERINKFRSEHSIMLENFFHSVEFASGILRLLKALYLGTITAEEEIVFVTAFQSIKVWQVTSLRTYVALKTGEGWIRIEHSEDDNRECYIEKDPDGPTSIYFVASEQDELFRWDHLANDLTVMIQELVQFKLRFRYISRVIGCIGKEEQIDNRLNKLGIPDYRASRSVEDSLFPRPGTYVPVKFHPFLDNAQPIFDVHEYRFVAMEKYDPLTDGENFDDSTLTATYIYVSIIERIDRNTVTLPMYQRYRVDVGEPDYVTVPAYKIYRFLRNRNLIRDVVVSEATNQATENMDTMQESSDSATLQSYSEACKEIRECLRKSWDTPEQRSIIKFLRLKWHPDKNPGQEELCHRVFVYLQQCIARLENNQPLQDENDDNVDGTQQQFASSRYAPFFSGMNERFRQYHETYQEEGFPSASNHRESAKAPQPSPSEARIWKRQAKADLQDAKISLENYYSASNQQDIPAANWICYRCHQAIEKALKAAWFFKDANELRRRNIRLSHSIEQIAFGLGMALQSLASRMTRITGVHTRMRYPDAYGHDRIPADMYTREQAEECCRIAEEVVQEVSRDVN